MRDEVVAADGSRRESFGGTAYNAMALSSMLRTSDRVVPILFASREHVDALRGRVFAARPQVSFAGMRACSEGTDENVLTYRTGNDRDERMTLRTPALQIQHLAECEDSHGLLVNFVSGRELSLDTMKMLRRMTRGLVHVDVHNLCRKLDADGRLVPGTLPDWRAWLGEVDSVQANETEAEIVLGRPVRTDAEVRSAVLEFLSLRNVRAACITLGAGGCMVGHRLGPDGALRIARLAALEVSNVVDTTGCGDCWASGFVVGMLRHRNPVRAALLGTTVAGLNASGSGLETLPDRARRLEDTMLNRFPAVLAKIERGWLGEEV